MNKLLNKYNVSFTGMQAFLWSGFAIYYSFFVPYLKSHGYTELNIGIIMSILSFVGIIGPILWGAVSDRLKSAKGILVINLLVGCISAQFIPAAVGTYAVLMAILILMNLTLCAQPPVLDSWAMRLKSRGAPINYGLTRGAGSLAYAITSMIAGVVLTKFGMNTMFPILLGFGCLTALCVLLMRDKPSAQTEEFIPAAPIEPEAPLYKNRSYIIFVLLATVLFIGVSASLTFYPLLLQNAGGTTADIGLALGICALSEFPIMMLSGKLLSRFKDTTLLLAAMGFYILRIFLFYTMHDVAGLVWAQLTNSLSFGIFLPTSVHYINRITPGRTKAMALSLASSMYMGLGGILGSLLGGIISANFGLRPLFGLAGVVVTVVTVAFGIVLLVARGKTTKKVENDSLST